MKNPRISLHRVPGHRIVGAAVAKTINDYLDENPDLQKRMHAAIGDSSKTNKGPTQEQVDGLTQRVESYFNIKPGDRVKFSMTQLHQPLYLAWVERSGDPDIYVPIWLRQGAPIGILREAEPAGIFPRARQQQKKKDVDP